MSLYTRHWSHKEASFCWLLVRLKHILFRKWKCHSVHFHQVAEVFILSEACRTKVGLASKNFEFLHGPQYQIIQHIWFLYLLWFKLICPVWWNSAILAQLIQFHEKKTDSIFGNWTQFELVSYYLLCILVFRWEQSCQRGSTCNWWIHAVRSQ